MRLRAVVATDGTGPSGHLATAVEALAGHVSVDPTLVHVVSLDRLTYKMIPDLQLEQIREGANRLGERLLQREAQAFHGRGLGVGQKLLAGGDVATTLCRYAERLEADVLMIGRGHRRGDLQGARLGPTGEKLLQHCRRPLLVFRPDRAAAAAAGSPGRALLAVDGTDATERCIAYLERIAPALPGVDLTVLSVFNRQHPEIRDLPQNARYRAVTRLRDAGAELLKACGERLRSCGFQVRLRQAEGSVGATINRACEEERCGLVFMGRGGLGSGMDPLHGAVSRHVAARCSADVWLVG